MRVSVAFALIGPIVVGCAAPASAQSFVDTIRNTYKTNPELAAARSNARAVRTNIDIAQSLSRPSIGITSTYALEFDRQTYKVPNGTLTQSDKTHPFSLGINLVQPLFTGFQAEAKLGSAESAAKAQDELVRDTEETVLVDAATAYANVVLYTELISLDQKNLAFLTEQSRQAAEREKHGEATMVDIADAKAAYQRGLATLASDIANLAAGKAVFRQHTGLDAKALSEIPPLSSLLPADITHALKIAGQENPALRSAVYNVDVAQANVAYAEGALLPKASLQVSGTRTQETSGYLHTETGAATINASVPVYQGGAEYAQIRQAKEQLGTARLQVETTRAKLEAFVKAQWATIGSSRSSLTALAAQRTAAISALNGTIDQERLGVSTLLDVLNAQSLVNNTDIGIARTRQSEAVATFTVLQLIGRFDAGHVAPEKVSKK